MSAIKDLLDKVSAKLQGEPLRFISYGAAIVIVGAVAGLNALGITKYGENIDLPTALIMAGAAATILATVVESARKFVWPDATVQGVIAETIGEADGGVS